LGSTLAERASHFRDRAGFVSRDAETAHRAVADALNKHRVSWGRGAVDTALHCTTLGNLKIVFLRYGPPVRVERQEGDFYIVQAALRGRAMFRGRTGTVAVDRSTGAVLSPTSCGMLDWSAGCEQILVKVPEHAVASAWRTLTGLTPPARLLEFAPTLALDSAGGSWFRHLVDCAARALPPAGSGRTGAALARRLEELFVLNLLTAQPHTLSAAMADHGGSLAPKSVRLAEDYMRAHLQQPVSLFELAGEANVSVRALLKAFRGFRGTSPMATMRAMRLDAARADLVAADAGERVADVALRWGFGHLGRFAAQYRRRFGEAPSATLRS
jgi:AraC-like DNA-binding protein